MKMVAAVYNVSTDAIDHVTQNRKRFGPSMRVRMALMAKLLSDLRAAVLTAQHGYAAQSAVIGSSLYETAFTVVYIGTDESLARAWIEHGKAKPLDPFKGIWELTEVSLRLKIVPNNPERLAKLTTEYYQKYSQLCLIKHNNAVALAQQVFRRVGGQEVNWVGPDHSDHALRTACFVLELSVLLAHTAVMSLLVDYGTPPENEHFRPRLDAIAADWKGVTSTSRACWAGPDPFPGKWRTGRRRRPQ
jgi:hypothetical protein